MKTSKERLRPAAGSGRVGKPEIIEDLTPVEAEQVDEAVRYINERAIQSGLELAKDIGDYVLKTFFDGDYAKFTNASRSKSTSFRALVAREDLILGSSMIYVFVRVSRRTEEYSSSAITAVTLGLGGTRLGVGFEDGNFSISALDAGGLRQPLIFGRHRGQRVSGGCRVSRFPHWRCEESAAESGTFLAPAAAFSTLHKATPAGAVRPLPHPEGDLATNRQKL